MARKRKASKSRKSSGRRRRVSGPSDQTTQLLVGIGAGVAAAFAVGEINKSLTKKGKKALDPTLTGAVQVGLGAFLIPQFTKDPMFLAAGYGIAVGGGISAGKKMLNVVGNPNIVVPVRRALPAPRQGVDALVSGTKVNGNGVPGYVGATQFMNRTMQNMSRYRR